MIVNVNMLRRRNFVKLYFVTVVKILYFRIFSDTDYKEDAVFVYMDCTCCGYKS